MLHTDRIEVRPVAALPDLARGIRCPGGPAAIGPATPNMVSMTTTGTRPDDLPTDDVPTDGVRVEEALRQLSDVPFGLGVAVKKLSRSGGVYAWWAAPSILPDLPGPPNA